MENRIISMSLHDEVLDEIDRITEEMGFKGRSETIRAGIRSLRNEQREKSKLKGKINATLSVVHEHAKDLGKISHKYQNIITSHLHNHLSNDKCLDVFVIYSNADLIRDIVEIFQKLKNVEQIKLMVC